MGINLLLLSTRSKTPINKQGNVHWFLIVFQLLHFVFIELLSAVDRLHGF